MADQDLKVRLPTPTVQDSYLRQVKARLKDHSKAFEGLMALIPADYYYGKDNSDQWQRKKQTKEEKRAAKRAKLEPGAYKSALDVHREREQQENERKRKREVDDDSEAAHDVATSEPAQPVSKTAREDKSDDVKNKAKKNKKRPTETAEEDEQVRQEKANKRKQKNRERKERKNEEKQKKRERKRAKQEHEKHLEQGTLPNSRKPTEPSDDHTQRPGTDPKNDQSSRNDPSVAPQKTKDNSSHQPRQNKYTRPNAANFLTEQSIAAADGDDKESQSASGGSSPEHENLFDATTNDSSASSSSSVVPPSNPSDLDAKPEERIATASSDNEPANRIPSQSSSAKGSAQNDTDSRSESVKRGVKVTKQSEESTNQASQASSTQNNAQSAAQGSVSQPRELDIRGDDKPGGVTDEQADGKAETQLPNIDRQVLMQRLSEKMAALRAARKADGPNGKPARNRAELIEARRRKADVRKQRKKEQIAKDREAQDAETEAARLRGGNGSPIWSPSLYSPGGALANQQEPNFQFGKVAFEDGVEVDAGNAYSNGNKTKKGKSDPKTALLAAEKKRARLAGFDSAKRAELEEKDAWSGARNRIAGQKGRDDTNLLKKTLKRKEKAKGKSEREWNERLEGVRKGQEMRQAKREENLKKRREMKGVKGKDQKKFLAKQKGGGVQKPKQKKRPGFEGTFKTAARRT
ncbi:MAG: hypothetical protein Q9159_005029 [Coniocarpon cinnabarinum]